MELTNTAPVRQRSMTERGWDDMVTGLADWRLWHLMGSGAIRRRYARSRLGQFWTTLSTAIMVTILGLTWSVLWKLPLKDIFAFIAVSMVLWQFLTGAISDATTAMITSGHYFLNHGMSFSTPIYSIFYSQLI